MTKKAKVKASGEIIEVEKILDAMYRDNTTFGIDEKIYYESDLELLPEESPESATTEGWVARDENGDINIFDSKPARRYDFWMTPEHYYLMRDLQYQDPNIFPSVTWESEPLKCRITITTIEE